MKVRTVPAPVTYDLRRRVLRAGLALAEVAFAGDDDPGAFHLAVVDHEGRVVAVASALPAPTGHRPRRRSWRLRGMAVEPGHQRRGLGTVLLDAVVAQARDLGAEVLWAAGRDSALGFYRRRGWQVEGEAYLAGGGIGHHTVVLDLVVGTAPGPRSAGGEGPRRVAGTTARGTDPPGDEES